MDEAKQADFRLLLLDILAMTDGTVRPADTTQPNEGDEYAIVQWSSADHMGVGSATDLGRDQLLMLTATVDFFGARAWRLAKRLPMALAAASERLDDLGLGFLDADPVRNLTALELERIVRYQVVLRFEGVESWVFDAPTPSILAVSVGAIAEI